MKTKKQIKEKIKQISTLRRNLIVDSYNVDSEKYDHLINEARRTINLLEWVIK